MIIANPIYDTIFKHLRVETKTTWFSINYVKLSIMLSFYLSLAQIIIFHKIPLHNTKANLIIFFVFSLKKINNISITWIADSLNLP